LSGDARSAVGFITIMIASDMRTKIDRLISAGQLGEGLHFLSRLWAQEKSTATASFLVSRFERLRPQLKLLPYRVGILRSFTVEPMVPLLRAAAFCAGIDLQVYLSDFNAYVQEIVDPSSSLYEFAADAVILAIQTRDIAPALWNSFSLLERERNHALVAQITGDFGNWVREFRRHSRAHLIIHNLEQPVAPSAGILDGQSAEGQKAAIEEINRELRALCAEQVGVYALDYDAMAARHGRASWHDEYKWSTVRLPIAAPNLIHLVNEWVRFLHPLTGKVAKVLVTDLDNTLWGGILGEDGMDGICLGSEYPGSAFQELHRVLIDLQQRGIVLAICSKNNRTEALEALQNHPGMLLKPNHFAAVRINWEEKVQNLRELAAELNVGIDALALLDDSPVEREQVRRALPEVFLIDLPSEPSQFACAVRESPIFERLVLSSEDAHRSAMYQAQQERQQLQQAVSSREDFYRSLQQEAEIAPITKATLARAAQLIKKTNQFNLTNQRYTEQQILELAASRDWECFSMRVQDRFGDNGLVGVALLHHNCEMCEVDTFLLSCRVIGRTVETAFLAFLVEHAWARGARRLQGWFVPSSKNAAAESFYPRHGFHLVEQNAKGGLWSLDLAQQVVACPEWIRLVIRNGAE